MITSRLGFRPVLLLLIYWFDEAASCNNAPVVRHLGVTGLSQQPQKLSLFAY